MTRILVQLKLIRFTGEIKNQFDKRIESVSWRTDDVC